MPSNVQRPNIVSVRLDDAEFIKLQECYAAYLTKYPKGVRANFIRVMMMNGMASFRATLEDNLKAVKNTE